MRKPEGKGRVRTADSVAGCCRRVCGMGSSTSAAAYPRLRPPRTRGKEGTGRNGLRNPETQKPSSPPHHTRLEHTPSAPSGTGEGKGSGLRSVILGITLLRPAGGAPPESRLRVGRALWERSARPAACPPRHSLRGTRARSGLPPAVPSRPETGHAHGGTSSSRPSSC
jgi:hypothetical protein